MHWMRSINSKNYDISISINLRLPFCYVGRFLSTHIFNLSTVCAHCTSNKNQHALMLFNGNRFRHTASFASLHNMDNAEEYWITTRGVTRLDGVRGKKQVWRPHWTWGLSEANAQDFLAPPAVIRRLHNDLARGELCPLPTRSLRPWLLRTATPLNKPWYSAPTRGIREPLALGGKIFNSPEFLHHCEENE